MYVGYGLGAVRIGEDWVEWDGPPPAVKVLPPDVDDSETVQTVQTIPPDEDDPGPPDQTDIDIVPPVQTVQTPPPVQAPPVQAPPVQTAPAPFAFPQGVDVDDGAREPVDYRIYVVLGAIGLLAYRMMGKR